MCTAGGGWSRPGPVGEPGPSPAAARRKACPVLDPGPDSSPRHSAGRLQLPSPGRPWVAGRQAIFM